MEPLSRAELRHHKTKEPRKMKTQARLGCIAAAVGMVFHAAVLADDVVAMGSITVDGFQWESMVGGGAFGATCTRNCDYTQAPEQQTWEVAVVLKIRTRCHPNSTIRNTTSRSSQAARDAAILVLNDELPDNTRIAGDIVMTPCE